VERGDSPLRPEPSQPQTAQGYAHLRSGDSRFPSLLPHRDQSTKTLTKQIIRKRPTKSLLHTQKGTSQKEIYDCEHHPHTKLPFKLLALIFIDRNKHTSFLFPQIVSWTTGKACLRVTADLKKSHCLCCFPSLIVHHSLLSRYSHSP